MFTTSDSRQLFLSLSQAGSLRLNRPPLLELSSGAGVILERSLEASIADVIFNSSSRRVSIFELAAQLFVDPTAIERLLPTESSRWGRTGSTIISASEFTRLESQLLELLSKGLVSVTECCKSFDIDQDLMLRLVPNGTKTVSSGGLHGGAKWAFGLDFLMAQTKEMMELMEKLTEPIEIDQIFANQPREFVQLVLSEVKKAGAVPGKIEKGRTFVPQKYVKEVEAGILQQLAKDGIVVKGNVQDNRIAEPFKFLAVEPSVHSLPAVFVTSGFLEKVSASIQNSLKISGWADPKLLEAGLGPEDEKLVLQMLQRPPFTLSKKSDSRGCREICAMFVLPDLESQLKKGIEMFAISRAEEAWRNQDGKRSKIGFGTIKWQDLLKYVSCWKYDNHFSDGSQAYPLHKNLAAQYSQALHTAALSAFSQSIVDLRQTSATAAKAAILQKFYLRFAIHNAGLRSLLDASLKGKLGVEMVEFAIESGTSALGKLAIGLSEVASEEQMTVLDAQKKLENLKTMDIVPLEQLQAIDTLFRQLFSDLGIEVSSQAFENKRLAILNDLKKQLEDCQDPSQGLLLTVTILLGANNGIVKATGKFVPKLLKELGKRGEITEGDLQYLNEVKALVIKGNVVGEEVLGKLRTMGKQEQ